MNNYELGAGALLAFALIGWHIITEIRIRELQAALTISNEKAQDDKIKSDVHALSESDLNNEVRDFLGGSKPGS